MWNLGISRVLGYLDFWDYLDFGTIWHFGTVWGLRLFGFWDVILEMISVVIFNAIFDVI